MEVNKIYTYFDEVGLAHQEDLIQLWRKSWENQGFKATVLTKNDAASHPFYKKFNLEIQALCEEIMGQKIGQYGMACWLRWLAYANQVEDCFYVSDYDVINKKFTPKEVGEKLQLYDLHVPCFASGTPKQFLELCKSFIDITRTNLTSLKQHSHYHDQEFFLYNMQELKQEIIFSRHRDSFFSVFGQQNESTELVHFSHFRCGGNERNRINLIKKYLELPSLSVI